MNKISISILCFFVCFISNAQIDLEPQGGEYVFNPSNKRCVTPAQRAAINTLVADITKTYRETNRLVNSNSVQQFIWPVQKSANAPYFDVSAISNFVDHNSNYPQQLSDYNCGQRTYDTNDGYNHLGTDIFTWPFSWDQFQNDYAEAVAAAPGTIVYKSDGNFDQSCNFNSNDWNAVYIQHFDGSVALYGHLKSNSLTNKNVGDSVSSGEYLGVIGSSGNSTGPHLHFEIYDVNNSLIDPYVGNCNNINVQSWWATPQNYREPTINGLLTLSAPPNFNSCPQQETINQESNFDYGDMAFFSVYLRDQEVGSVINFSLKSPSNTTNINWSQTANNTYSASYWFYNLPVDTNTFNEEGEWTFEATLNGTTESITFNIGELSVEKTKRDEFLVSIYPNPTADFINIESSKAIQEIVIRDLNGRKIQQNKYANKIDISHISSGIYFIELIGTNQRHIEKIIKK